MFYIIQFYKGTIFQFRGFLFFVFTLVLALSMTFRPAIDQVIRKNLKVETPLPYFHVLIAGQSNVDIITRKVKGLPHVKRVRLKENRSINQKATQLIKSLALKSTFESEISTYNGLQVFLTPDVTERRFDLIKEYIQRVSGQSRLTFSTIKHPDVSYIETKKMAIEFLHRYGSIIISTFLFCCWILSLFLIREGKIKNAFLIENFQRRQLVAFKSYLLGMLTLLAPFVILATVGAQTSMPATIIFMLIIFLSSLLFFKKAAWH